MESQTFAHLGFGTYAEIRVSTFVEWLQEMSLKLSSSSENPEDEKSGSLRVYCEDQRVVETRFVPIGDITDSRIGQHVIEGLEKSQEESQGGSSVLVILQIQLGGQWYPVDLGKTKFRAASSKLECDNDGPQEPFCRWLHTEKEDCTDFEATPCKDYVRLDIVARRKVQAEIHIIPEERQGLPSMLVTGFGPLNPYPLIRQAKKLLSTLNETPLLGGKDSVPLKKLAWPLDVKGVVTHASDPCAQKWLDKGQCGHTSENNCTFYADIDGKISNKRNYPDPALVELHQLLGMLSTVHMPENLKDVVRELETALETLEHGCYQLCFNLQYQQYSSAILAADQPTMCASLSSESSKAELKRVQTALSAMVQGFKEWAGGIQGQLKELFALYKRALEVKSQLHLIEPLLGIEFDSPEAKEAIRRLKQEAQRLKRMAPETDNKPLWTVGEQRAIMKKRKREEEEMRRRGEEHHPLITPSGSPNLSPSGSPNLSPSGSPNLSPSGATDWSPSYVPPDGEDFV